MAIFTAGSIPLTSDIQRIRNEVYAISRRELDSSAIKVSLRKCADGINYVAFLPKAKLYYENILKTVSTLSERSVVVFELEYKQVGVICEEEKIVDYILDKPEEYAKEFGYSLAYVDNSKGTKLVSLNLDQHRREMWMGTFLLLCTVFVTTLIFYVGYDYLKAIPLMKKEKMHTQQEYEAMLKEQRQKISMMTKKVDLLGELESIEKITRNSGSYLRQVSYENGKTCVEIKAEDLEKIRPQLPDGASIIKEDAEEGSVQYCYEKI